MAYKSNGKKIDADSTGSGVGGITVRNITGIDCVCVTDGSSPANRNAAERFGHGSAREPGAFAQAEGVVLVEEERLENLHSLYARR